MTRRAFGFITGIAVIGGKTLSRLVPTRTPTDVPSSHTAIPDYIGKRGYRLEFTTPVDVKHGMIVDLAYPDFNGLCRVIDIQPICESGGRLKRVTLGSL